MEIVKVNKSAHSPKVSYITIGCKLNFTETSTIERLLTNQGYRRVSLSENPDFVIVNTCTVTASASKKSRQAIRKAHHVAPGAKIIAVGCYSQLQPENLANMPEVYMVLGNNEKHRITEFLQFNHKPGKFVSPVWPIADFYGAFSAGQRTRSFLKIQDGCDYFCAYCTVPHARGPSRSPEIQFIVDQAKSIVAGGVKEIVLTGVNIGDFGRKNNQNLLMLLQKLTEIDGLGRIRISSIEPDLLSDEMIKLIASSPIIAPHFHIPLQSATDHLLKAMRRRYDTALFIQKTETIRKLIPDACIAADLIVGLPGESKEDFDYTISFIKQSEISYLHLFPYSERENTPAALMHNKVDEKEKKYRIDTLTKLSEEKWKQFCIASLNSKQIVLFESTRKAQQIHGLTGNYITFETRYETNLINQFREVLIEGFTNEGHAYGRIL